MGLEELARLGFEALAYSVVEARPIDTWRISGGEAKLPYTAGLRPGELLEASNILEAGEPPSGHRWLLYVGLNGSALVVLNGEPWWGLDEAHPYAFIPPGRHLVSLRISPLTFFGLYEPLIVIGEAFLVRLNWRLYSTAIRLLGLIEYLGGLEKPWAQEVLGELGEHLAEIVRGAPSLQQVAVAARLLGQKPCLSGFCLQRVDVPRVPAMYGFLANRYGWRALREGLRVGYERPVDPDWLAEELEQLLHLVAGKLPSSNRGSLVFLAGHSHIDAAWLWPLAETKEKVLRVFSTVANLLEEYDWPVFVQSSTLYYRWVEELSPSLFEKIRRLINTGRWVPVGGMLVETDTNLVSGETLARQLLYGQLYLRERLGRYARIGWLPDSFGYSAGLPQLLVQAGIRALVIHKLVWNDTNRFPYRVFVWEGSDGSRIVTELVPSYSEPGTLESLAKYSGSNKAPRLYLYGYGDGGGGPTPEMLEQLSLAKELPVMPRVESFEEQRYLDQLSAIRDELPVWRGELYLEKHRGTYTTNLEIKELFAEAETRLGEAEIVATLAWLRGAKRYLELRGEWERLLLSAFHDVLPGSSIREVYEEAREELLSVTRRASGILVEALAALVGEGDALTIFNTLPWRRRAVITLRGVEGLAYGGELAECQGAGEEKLFLVEAPGLGYRSYRVTRGCARPRDGVRVYEASEYIVLENEYLRAKIGRRDALLHSLRVKGLGEVLAAPSNRVLVHPDKPGLWDAWDLDKQFISKSWEPWLEEEPRITLGGGLLGCIEYSYQYSGSRIAQRVCLAKGSRLLSFETKLGWRDKGVVAKAWFYPAWRIEHYVAEAPYGIAIREPREAMYEAPALHWLDTSDGGTGLALVSRSRHGYSVLSDRVGLSIVKSPVFPNPWSDLGDLATTYYLYPHRGGYEEAQVPLVAEEQIHAPIVLRGGIPGREEQFLWLSEPLVLGGFKKAERGNHVVLRLFNPYPVTKTIRVRLHAAQVCGASVSNLLEEEQEPLEMRRGEMLLRFRPLELKTILLTPC